MGTLKDKVALVTGAGRRGSIGAAVALRLAQDGAHVAVADICAPASRLPNAGNGAWEDLAALAGEIEALGVRSLAIKADVSDIASVREMIGAVKETFGRLDILVNNAGVAIAPAPVLQLAEEAWRRTLEINATGTFLCCKVGVPAIVEGGRGGRVINMASIAAERPKPGVSAYAASKAAVVALTRSLAQEVARMGITVNAVLPGDVDTAMKQWGVQYEANVTGQPADRVLAGQIARVPLGRFAKSEDVAGLVAFLASDAAAFVTGQAWNLTGGRELT